MDRLEREAAAYEDAKAAAGELIAKRADEIADAILADCWELANCLVEFLSGWDPAREPISAEGKYRASTARAIADELERHVCERSVLGVLLRSMVGQHAEDQAELDYENGRLD